MATTPSTRTKVFISYSHADKKWLDRLKRHLKPLVREGRLDCWDDTHIQPGDDWKQEIQNALDTAQVAVLLISANFFASDFIDENELLPLLAAAQDNGVRILPVILSASRFAWHPDLARFQAVNSLNRPLAKVPPAEQEEVFDRLAQTIESALNLGAPTGTTPGRLSDQLRPLQLFIFYAHADDPFRQQLETHLSGLKRQDLVQIWSNQAIKGQEWERSIHDALETAEIILLLVSPDFLASECIYDYNKELKRAMQRHEAGQARVIPVLLRPCDWKGAPFGNLQGVPDNAKPISRWEDRDEAFSLVARELRAAVETFRKSNPRILNCKDIITVKLEDIFKVDVDVVVLKHANGFYGADRKITEALGTDIVDMSNFHVEKGSTRIVVSSSRICASYVLYVGVGELYEFSYDEIREFGAKALTELRTALPKTRYIAMTIHGARYGLDEIEAFFSLYAGPCDAIKAGRYPPNLQGIYIVDKNPNRVQRLTKALFNNDNINQKNGPGQASWSKPSIFVAMPFSDEFDDIFYLGIQNPAHEENFLCERIDQEVFMGDILEQIKRRIESASIVIAELTGNNPNVYLEIGYAWGCRRPTILLLQEGQKPRFDVQGQRIITYRRIVDLQKELKKALNSFHTEKAKP